MRTPAYSTRFLRAFAIPAVLLLACGQLFAAGQQDFTLVNATAFEIREVYVSPHEVADWEEDVLGQDTLPSGQSVHITFNRKEKTAHWDLKVVDQDGNSYEWENLNLLEITKLTLHYAEGRAWAVID